MNGLESVIEEFVPDTSEHSSKDDEFEPLTIPPESHENGMPDGDEDTRNADGELSMMTCQDPNLRVEYVQLDEPSEVHNVNTAEGFYDTLHVPKGSNFKLVP